MANPLKGIIGKTKTAGGKMLDYAAKGAAYSQRYGSANEKMTMSQRVGGAISEAAMNATLGQMGTLGQAMRAGLTSRGSTKSPTGGSGVPSTTVQATPIKTSNVVQAINQSTKQILGGLNTLNATFRMGLNATANQMQAQATSISSLKRDTEDMVISLREIYELLNKQGYQNSSGTNVQPNAPQRVESAPITSSNQNSPSMLQDILTGALLSLAPVLVSSIGGLIASVATPLVAGVLGLGALGAIGAYIMGSKPASEAQKAQEKAADNIPTNMNKGVTITNPRAAGAAGIKKSTSPDTGQGSTSSTTTPNNAGSELTKEEIDEIFRIAPKNAADDVLFEIAKNKFPGRKYNTLKQRIQMLRSLMQPQSSLSGGVKVASADMSSGSYLVSRQKMLENTRSGTSEQALRQEEQKLEQDAFEGVIPQLLNYESREMMYKADKIVFDAGKIEFLESMGMGGGEGGGGGSGTGADKWRDGGTQSRDGSGVGGGDATKVPPKTLSSEQQKFFSDLEKGNIDAGSARAEFLKNKSPEELSKMGLKTVTAKDGSVQYAKADVTDQQAVESLKQKAATGGKFTEGGSFEENSPVLMQRLMKDFNLTPEQAAGVVGNLGHESAGLQAGIQEKNPVGGGRGGLGWAQWTGPRRKQFEAYLERTGQKATDPEANYGFLKEELMGSESGALDKLRQTSNVEDATIAFEQGYERAGVKHYGPRKDYANKAIQGYQANPNIGQMTPAELANFKPTQEQIAAEKSNIQKQQMQARVDIAGTSASQSAVAGVGPGNINVKEAYGPRRPERPDESIRNIASSAGEGAGMKDITFTSGKGNWISESGRRKGQKSTQHSTGKALDVAGFGSEEETLRFIEQAVARGAKGVGVYKDGSVHIDQGNERTWSWGGISKKKVDEAVRKGKQLGVKMAEDQKKQDAVLEQKKVESKINIKEEDSSEKAYKKLGVTPESKQRMVAENKAKADAAKVEAPSVDPSKVAWETMPDRPMGPHKPAAPPAANPTMLDPSAVHNSQKVSELSKKTTMNKESVNKTGPVTQNIAMNMNEKSDTTGNGFPAKDNPMPGMNDTHEKFTSMLFGVA